MSNRIAYMREYRKQKREKVRTQQREYEHKRRAANPEKYAAAQRIAKAKQTARAKALHPAKVHFNNIAKAAKHRGLAFTLTLSWFEERYAAGTCELTGLPFAVGTRSSKPSARAPSVDRRDSTRGYVPENCRLVLWGLNAAFNTWGEHEAAAIWKAYFEREWLR